MKEIKDPIIYKAKTETKSQHLGKHKSINLRYEYGNKMYVNRDCN